MRVGFAKARTGYANEPRAGAKIVDRRRADVAHARAESTDELMHDRRERTERANTTLDALGDELGELADVGLSVAVARTPRLHRAKRAHPAIRLERAVLGFHDIAGRFVHAREKSTDHPGPRTADDHVRVLRPPHLSDLLRHGQIPMDDTETAEATKRDGEPRVRDRIHGGGEDGNVEADLVREARLGGDLGREDVATGRDQEDVVEGQTFLGELVLPGQSAALTRASVSVRAN